MYRIGIDLGGTNIAAGIVSGDRILVKDSIPTGVERSAEKIVADIVMLCYRVCVKGAISPLEIESVGIAAPGIVNRDEGVIETCCNIPAFHKLPICAALKDGFPVSRVFAENDANAAAWGEAIAGVAKGTKDSVMITLGTGVGGGIIVDGHIVSGFNYAGGELGHMVIKVNGEPCACGRRGCWEAYSSATALVRMTCEKLDKCAATGRKTNMTDFLADRGRGTGRTAFDAMRAGDEAGTEVVDQYIHYLSIGLANIVNIFQPEVLSIGGGIFGEGDTLLDMLAPLVRTEMYGDGLVKGPDIRIASLKNDAGIIGAASLGDAIFNVQ